MVHVQCTHIHSANIEPIHIICDVDNHTHRVCYFFLLFLFFVFLLPYIFTADFFCYTLCNSCVCKRKFVCRVLYFIFLSWKIVETVWRLHTILHRMDCAVLYLLERKKKQNILHSTPVYCNTFMWACRYVNMLVNVIY